jgi:6-pyruvoyltetrahydropterin/6-carboxytetrahydropterin synthase
LIRLTRRYRFSASHRLHAPELSADQNRELYGKCNNPYGHGHDYQMEIGVAGPLDAATGQAVNLAALDALVAECVVRDFDHKNLNEDVPEFAALAPTSENIVAVIEARLERRWTSAFPQGSPRLEKIRLRETKRNLFERNA